MADDSKRSSIPKRVLLIWCTALTILGAIGLHVWLRINAFQEQQEAIAAVRRSGGSVFHSGDASWGFPGWLEALFHNTPYGVSYHNPETTDKELECLQRFTWVSDVRVRGTQVTGNGLRLLADIPRLETLFIGDSRITDSDLSVLQYFPRLKSIWIDYEQCTEVGIQGLSRIKGLESLSLMCSQCNHVSSVGPSKVTSIIDQLLQGPEYHAESCVKQQKQKVPRK